MNLAIVFDIPLEAAYVLVRAGSSKRMQKKHLNAQVKSANGSSSMGKVLTSILKKRKSYGWQI